METADLIDKAAQYTEKFVNAAIPVAKQAYEIGLLTLRIDAVQVIIFSLIGIGISIYALMKLFSHKKKCQIKVEERNKGERYRFGSLWDYSPFDELGYACTVILSLIPGLYSLFLIADIWLWVKMFCPDLWLAKQAITAVLQVVK